MPHLPALITSGDVMPGGGDLNGRRWAGHQLLRAWVRFAGESRWLWLTLIQDVARFAALA